MDTKTRAGVWGGVMLAALIFTGAGCKKKMPFGADCKDDMGCESLHCSSYGNICSKSCNIDKDCGAPYVCRADDNGFNMCSKAIGNPPNGSCMTPGDCDHGHCLHRVGEEDSPGICSALCNASDDCPTAGMKVCDSISDSAGAKYCLPGDPAAAPATRPKFGPQPKAGVKPKPKAVVTAPPIVSVPAPVPTPTAQAVAQRPGIVIPTAAAKATAVPAPAPVAPPAAVPKKK